MQAAITATLLRSLTAQALAADVDVRDTKLVGFTLRCRRSGVHTYRVQTGRGKWLTLGTADKLTPQQARDEATKVLAAVSLGADPVEERRAKRGALTLEAFVRDVYAPWALAHLETGAETVQRLAATFAVLHDVKLADLSGWHLERWRTSRRKAGVRPSTINRDLNDLRAMLARAVQWKHLRAHPLADVKPERTDRRGSIRYLSADEERRLLEALDARDSELRAGRDRANAWRASRGYQLLPTIGTFADHLSPLVRLALHTGLRRGELFQLRWADVHWQARRLTVQGHTAKTGQTRHVPLNVEAVRVLQAWGPPGEGLVFAASGGPDVPLVDVKTAWLKIMRDAQIGQFRFHDIRHTFASKLVQAGVDLAVVRDLLGHSSVAMTEKYAHLRSDQAVNAVELLAVHS